MTTTGHWHYAQLQIIPEDCTIHPVISPPVDDREQARAEIQGLLDRMMVQSPQLAKVAKKWRDDQVKDDWVYWGAFNWTIVECSGSCRDTVQALLEDWATELRAAGLRSVQVPDLPQDWPSQQS